MQPEVYMFLFTLDNTIWTYGGCAASVYNQLSALKLDVKLLPQNFYASGGATILAKAGVYGIFYGYVCFKWLFFN